MKLAVVGSRTFNDYDLLKRSLEVIPNITEIVSGGAKGADSLAEKWAFEHAINITIFKPDWEKEGLAAGFIRNKLIVDHCDKVIAFWDGKSKGTAHSISLAEKAHKECIIIRGA